MWFIYENLLEEQKFPV